MSGITNIAADKIYVFPLGSGTTRASNVFYEQNTVNMIRQLSQAMFGTTSFLIRADSGSVEFNIYGYYFKLDTSVIEEYGADVYATIKINNVDGIEYMNGQYQGETFNGLLLSTSMPEVDTEGEPSGSETGITQHTLVIKSSGEFVRPVLASRMIENSIKGCTIDCQHSETIAT